MEFSKLDLRVSPYGLAFGKCRFDSRQRKRSFLLRSVQDGFGAHTTSDPMDIGGFSPEIVTLL
jgi:hypothetical protein